MILVIDNYDSFTYNLVHLLYALGAELKVVRNREITVSDALGLNPEGILYSPGPGHPNTAGVMEDLIRAASKLAIPQMGVCLGHQAIGEVFGAKIVSAKRIMHGKLSSVTHDGRGLFEGLPSPFKAVRYHSLALEEATLPDVLEVTARAEDGEIMGVRHRTLPIAGIQYHPESIMSSGGRTVLENFLKMTCKTELERG